LDKSKLEVKANCGSANVHTKYELTLFNSFITSVVGSTSAADTAEGFTVNVAQLETVFREVDQSCQIVNLTDTYEDFTK
jgi:hypothetical protein